MHYKLLETFPGSNRKYKERTKRRKELQQGKDKNKERTRIRSNNEISFNHHFRYYLGYFGPSGVRALPLAAGINKGGHYFR